MYPGDIDICSFFFDDGFCAGSAPALRRFLSPLVRGFRLIGLEVNLGKTEVILACSSSQSFAPSDFPGCTWVGSSNFKLLGAPVRICLAGAFLSLGPSWPPLAGFLTCKELSVCFALALVGPRFSFPIALSILMLISSASTPPIVKIARLCRLIGRLLSDDDWRLASLGIAAGGLGARSAAEHAPAARFVRPLLDGL